MDVVWSALISVSLAGLVMSVAGTTDAYAKYIQPRGLVVECAIWGLYSAMTAVAVEAVRMGVLR